MAGFDFREPTTNGFELPLLFLNVNFNGIGNEEIPASPGRPRQPRKLPSDFRREANAYRRRACVSHTHKLTQDAGGFNE